VQNAYAALAEESEEEDDDVHTVILSGGNNGVVRPGRCGVQSAVLGPEGREFSKKY
jgi:hypothetical protein